MLFSKCQGSNPQLPDQTKLLSFHLQYLVYLLLQVETLEKEVERLKQEASHQQELVTQLSKQNTDSGELQKQIAESRTQVEELKKQVTQKDTYIEDFSKTSAELESRCRSMKVEL